MEDNALKSSTVVYGRGVKERNFLDSAALHQGKYIYMYFTMLCIPGNDQNHVNITVLKSYLV